MHKAVNSSGPLPSSTLFFLLHFSPAVTCLQPCGLALDAVMDNFAIPDEWEGGGEGGGEGTDAHTHTQSSLEGIQWPYSNFLLMPLTSAVRSFFLSFSFLSFFPSPSRRPPSNTSARRNLSAELVSTHRNKRNSNNGSGVKIPPAHQFLVWWEKKHRKQWKIIYFDEWIHKKYPSHIPLKKKIKKIQMLFRCVTKTKAHIWCWGIGSDKKSTGSPLDCLSLDAFQPPSLVSPVQQGLVPCPDNYPHAPRVIFMVGQGILRAPTLIPSCALCVRW